MGPHFGRAAVMGFFVDLGRHMSESRQIGTSLWHRPQKILKQGNPVLRDRAKGAFSLLLSLEQAKKVRQISFF